MENLLKEDWRKEGTTWESFEESAKRLSDATKIQPAYGRDLTLFSTIRSKKAQELDQYILLALDKNNVDRIMEMQRPNYVQLDKKDLSPYQEDFEQTGILLMNETLKSRDRFILSKHALMLLAARVGLGGERFCERNNYARDLLLADAITSLPDRNGRNSYGMRLVYRTDGKINKVFSVAGMFFSIIPQRVICEMLKEIKEEYGLEMGFWEISHEKTEVRLFDYTKARNGLVPGIRMINSDMGYSSYVFQNIIQEREDGEFFVTGETAVQHKYGVRQEDLLLELRKKASSVAALQLRQGKIDANKLNILPNKYKNLMPNDGDCFSFLRKLKEKGANPVLLGKVRKMCL